MFNKFQNGFTLVEMAIVLVISGLLVTAGFQLMSSSTDVAHYKETQMQMTEIKDALISSYMKIGRLPCPDTDNDGLENRNVASGVCDNEGRGFLPYATLNIANATSDAWGNRFKFIVSGDNSNFFTKTATICNYTRPITSGNTTVNVKDLTTTSDNFIAQYAAFALISTGKNGRETNNGMSGAFSSSGGCAVLNVLEQDNCNNDSLLRFGTQMSDGNSIVFDDLVSWVGDIELIGYLVQAGCSLK